MSAAFRAYFRKRGLIRTEYAGRTLREYYGLPRPQSQYAEARRLATPAPAS